jgi:hypothetical protein
VSNILDVIADHLPRVKEEEVVRRFSRTVEIRDVRAFAAELQAFVYEHVGAVELPASLDVSIAHAAAFEAMARKAAASPVEAMARKAKALRAGSRWSPGPTDIQRGRELQLATFAQPHLLPLAEFARLAHKSRQQIYKDIDARRLLALDIGRRGRKLPDWQLVPERQALTEMVVQGAGGIDDWTLYRALSEPLEGLAGRSPVDAVTTDSVEAIARAVFNVLGVH